MIDENNLFTPIYRLELIMQFSKQIEFYPKSLIAINYSALI